MRLRNLCVGLVLVCVATGCTRRYFVNPAHLARAQSIQDAALPALTSDREPTFVLASSIRRQEGVDGTGLLAVRARDARTLLRTTGWIATAIGVVYGTLALSFIGNDDPDSVESQLAFAFGVTSIAQVAIGVPFLVLGYVSSGAEEDGPSPGMPVRLTDP